MKALVLERFPKDAVLSHNGGDYHMKNGENRTRGVAYTPQSKPSRKLPG
jgi:hypothetical protein